MTGPIRYTKLTANEILPEVIDHLRALRRAQLENDMNQKQAARSSPTNGGPAEPRAWAQASEDLDRHLKWFADAGILVKSLQDGLVDFPAVIDGRPALLCWKEGEEEVAHWHTPEDGFPGRRPL